MNSSNVYQNTSMYKIVIGENCLLSSSDGQTLWITLDEVQIFTRPMKNFETRIKFEQQRFTRSIKKLGYMERTWCQSTKYLNDIELMNFIISISKRYCKLFVIYSHYFQYPE